MGTKTDRAKAKLLSDPNTPKLAQALGLSVEAWVDEVLHFVEHPLAEPELVMATDADLRAHGVTPCDEAEMLRWLQSAQAVQSATELTAFEPARVARLSLKGGN